MKSFLKKYGLFILQGVVMVIIAWNGYLTDNTGDVSPVKERLQKENTRLNRELEKSRQKETALRQELVTKERKIAELDVRLRTTMGEYHGLRGKLSSLPKAEDPSGFEELAECQEKYAGLVSQLNLCLAANEQGDLALNLTVEKMNTQNAIIQIQESTYLECHQQVDLTAQKLQETEMALDKLERVYQRKFLQKNTIIYMVGIVATITAGYLALRKR